MRTQSWIVIGLATLMTGCGGRQDDASEGAATTPANPVTPGSQTTTPGGVAGETAATPPGTQGDQQRNDPGEKQEGAARAAPSSDQ